MNDSTELRVEALRAALAIRETTQTWTVKDLLANARKIEDYLHGRDVGGRSLTDIRDTG